MKHWMKQITAAAMALSLSIGQAALASDALGHDLHAGTTALSQGPRSLRGISGAIHIPICARSAM